MAKRNIPEEVIEDQHRPVKHVARRLGTGVRFVYDEINHRNLAAMRLGRILRVSEKEIQRYIAEHKNDGPIPRSKTTTKTKKRAA